MVKGSGGKKAVFSKLVNLDNGLKYFAGNGPSVWIHSWRDTIACTHVFLLGQNKQETTSDNEVF